ncbi:MAG: Fic family protein [Paracoccaceae bacterium]|nr:Fic family protein [Paracoccaceae bacterium]
MRSDLERTKTVSGAIPEPTYQLPLLPPEFEWDSKPILKSLAQAHRALAQLNGRAAVIPNQAMLIETLALQEAAASSEIENIVTTQDQLFQTNPQRRIYPTPEAKEVALYSVALNHGFRDLIQKQHVLSNNCIVGMFQTLKSTTGGFRTTPGTVLKNERTGEIVFVPPQSAIDIQSHMQALESFINCDLPEDIDPLVAMAIIHHQFESIHPFPDGNGRLGRILNVLYLCKMKLLDIPILYISRFIVRHKDEYYRLLQETRDKGNWEPWVLFMLGAVENTARHTFDVVGEIRRLIDEFKSVLRETTKIYSHELVNNLFRHPYTRIEYVMDEVGVSRPTAGRYLDQIVEAGLLDKIRIGKNNYYVNVQLVSLLIDNRS